MSFQLRDYQQSFVDDIYDAWTRCRVVLGVLATGGGKTVCFSSVIRDHVGASAAVVHRKEIVSQISLSLAKLRVKHRIVAPQSVIRRIRRRHMRFLGKCYVDQHAQCGVVSVQTLASKSSQVNDLLMSWVNQVTLGVFDEGHHYVDSGSWAVAVEMLDKAKLLLVTATPKRADGKGLGAHASGFVEEMVIGPTTKWLIDEGHLAPFKYYAPQSDLDVSGVAVTAKGDFNAQALRARVVDSHLVGDVVTQYKQFSPGARFIVFSTDVLTAEEMAAEFRAHGMKCEALSGKTEAGLRDTELDKFENGENLGLTNVDLFDEGFDVPACESAVLARPTESLAKFLQMVGRILRPVYADGYDLNTREGRLAAIAAGPKPFASVIDPVRNWERHGMPDWPREWSLDNEEKGTRSTDNDNVPQKVCTGCTQPYEAFFKACPYCGHVEPPIERRKPEQVEGDLLELDVEALAALFAERQKADMSDEDFQRDMVARNVPKVAHGRQLRAHKAARYRRDVLRNLVGWWVGCQPAERTLSEKYRRFYVRYGIDMSTAFTLNDKDTDELIERVKQGFRRDM